MKLKDKDYTYNEKTLKSEAKTIEFNAEKAPEAEYRVRQLKDKGWTCIKYFTRESDNQRVAIMIKLG